MKNKILGVVLIFLFSFTSVCFAEDKNIISKDNIIKFIEQFEEEYKAKKEFNLDLLMQFISYILDK